MSDVQVSAEPAVETPTAPDSINESQEQTPENQEPEAEVDAIDAALNADGGDETQKTEPPPTKKEINALKKKLKLKVDGKEFEHEVDFNDDESLVRELQKAKAFDKRSQEASTMRKHMEELVHLLQTNPEAVLEQLGHNVDEFAEKRLRTRLEEMQKSPEQIAQEKMQKELETLRKEKEEASKVAENARMEQLRNQYASEIENDIDAALQGQATLPKSPLVIKRIAETMMLAMQHGFNDVKAKDVIPIVEKQFKEELKGMFDVLPEDTIEALVGNNNLDRLRKKRLNKRATEVKTAKNIVAETAKTAPKQVESKKMSFSEFFGNKTDE